MTGTSASFRPRAVAAVGLPVPRVYLVAPSKARAGANPNGIDYMEMLDAAQVRVQSMPYLSASEIPKELFARDLRLELLRYSVKKGSTTQKRGRSGYKHPTHEVTNGAGWLGLSGATPVAAPLPLSKHRGGSRATTTGAPNSQRMTTEWSVADADASFLIDTLGDFYMPGSVFYNTAAGPSGGLLNVHVPSDRAARGFASPRNVFGYAAAYRPNYFKFRFSVSDPTDPRNRITGPTGDTFVMAPSVHPFIQDIAASQTAGFVVVRLNDRFDPKAYNVWMNTRLPGGAT